MFCACGNSIYIVDLSSIEFCNNDIVRLRLYWLGKLLLGWLPLGFPNCLAGLPLCSFLDCKEGGPRRSPFWAWYIYRHWMFFLYISNGMWKNNKTNLNWSEFLTMFDLIFQLFSRSFLWLVLCVTNNETILKSKESNTS